MILFLTAALGMMLSGIGFAYYLSVYCTLYYNTVRAHVLQWWWSILGALSMWTAGYLAHSCYTEWAMFGTSGSILVLGGVGYVIGRKLFF